MTLIAGMMERWNGGMTERWNDKMMERRKKKTRDRPRTPKRRNDRKSLEILKDRMTKMQSTNTKHC